MSWRRASEPIGFALAGGLALLVAFVPGADPLAHLGLVAAATAMLVTGGWVEERLGLTAVGNFAFHRVVLGQAFFLLYFYLRSLLSHTVGLPGVGTIELFALTAAVALDRWRRRPRTDDGEIVSSGVVWLIWWISALAFIGLRSGHLGTPSSDPDIHAVLARLIAGHGRLIYDLSPIAEASVSYPSGFGAENAIWMLLSGVDAVTSVNCQVALQAALAVGLAVEVVTALRGRVSIGASLVLVVVAHFGLALPVSAHFPHLEGTARLAHKALAILPLTFAVCVSRSALPRWQKLWSVAAVLTFAAAWTVASNAALLVVELPILVAAFLYTVVTVRRAPRDRPFASGNLAPAVVMVLAPLLLVASDAWVRSLFRPASPVAASAGAPAPAPAARPMVAPAIASGLRHAIAISKGGIIPPACEESSQCQPVLRGVRDWLPVWGTLAALLVLVWARLRRYAGPAAVAWLALIAAEWLVRAAQGVIYGLTGEAPTSLYLDLLHNYTTAGVRSHTALLFLLILATSLALLGGLFDALARGRRPRWIDGAAALVAAGYVAFCLRGERLGAVRASYQANVLGAPISNLGFLEPLDVELAVAAASLVPRGERVLLLGTTGETPWEQWNFAYGPSRALPLYTDTGFAFFHGLGSFGAPSYTARVCDTFDLPWLASVGVKWVFFSNAGFEINGGRCPHGWAEIRDHYFEERLRRGDRALYRLREDRLPEAAHDPRLGL